MERTRSLLINHCKAYPKLLPQDIFKFLYQSSFGCEHMVSDCEKVTDYIRKEAAEAVCDEEVLCEELDGEYIRVHLGYLKKGMSPETLGKLFMLSAKKEDDGEKALKEKLKVAEQMAKDGSLPLDANEFQTALEAWKKDGFPPLHHSDTFKKTYHPSYRVVSKVFQPFLAVFAEADAALRKNGRVHLAIDGRCASGKSTFAALLEKVYGCTVFHMDDFFLRPEQRNPERYAEAGGNIDRERFLEEVLVPYKKGEAVDYGRFDCSSLEVLAPVKLECTPLTVTEGVYCMHPLLADYYDLTVFLDISEVLQRDRILKRNSPEFARRFFEKWIPMENRYFDEMNVMGRCEITVCVG